MGGGLLLQTIGAKLCIVVWGLVKNDWLVGSFSRGSSRQS